MVRIYPSLIGGNLLALGDQIDILNPYCDGYHLDLMDGHFVPNITWGPAFINAIAQATQRHLWIHLMVTDPACWLSRFSIPPASMVDFHIETKINARATLMEIKKRGWRSGLALKPQTPLTALEPFFDLVDYVLIMAVDPGFSGQAYLSASLAKVQALAEIKKRHRYAFAIAVDGGIDATNIKHLTNAGVTHAGAASAIFLSADPLKALDRLYHAVRSE